MTIPFQQWLRVGIVQTTLDNEAAWAGSISIAPMEEERAVSELQQHLASLALETPKPQVVLIPEVAVPLGFRPRLRRIAQQMNCIIIAGLDFEEVPGSNPKAAHNRAMVIVPNRWGEASSSSSLVRYVGKTYCSYEEGQLLTKYGYSFRSIPEIWVFDGGPAGRFGVAVCFDMLDLERVATYRLQLQHLFIWHKVEAGTNKTLITNA